MKTCTVHYIMIEYIYTKARGMYSYQCNINSKLMRKIKFFSHEQLYKSRSFVSLLPCSIQVCVNTMPRRKDISNDLREAIVAAHQSGKGYKAISIILQRERLFTSGKHSGQLSIFPGVDVPASSPQGEKAKSYISDSTGLS